MFSHKNAFTDILKYPNVYLHEGLVYKFFDTVEVEYTKPNMEVVLSILKDDYLHDMANEDLTDDGRYKMLKYQFIENDIAYDDFKPTIMSVLDDLHKHKCVHSDVRLANTVFPKNGVAKLIDFDLTKLMWSIHLGIITIYLNVILMQS